MGVRTVVKMKDELCTDYIIESALSSCVTAGSTCLMCVKCGTISCTSKGRG